MPGLREMMEEGRVLNQRVEDANRAMDEWRERYRSWLIDQIMEDVREGQSATV